MKTLFTPALLLATVGLAQAQEIGQVTSRTAVYQQVAVPRQTCTQTPVAVQPQTSGAGALMGAIAGGAVGHNVGGGSGQAIATIAGMIGGAMLGDKIENPGAAQAQSQQTCTTQTVYENRLIGYNVVYEYAGKQYNVQLPQDPGPTIQLQVTPMGAPRSEAPLNGELPPASVVATAPAAVVVQTPPVVYTSYPVYRPWPVYTSVNLGWGYARPYGYGHRHWR
jgi:uncharacterized protein YcfJ